MSDALVTSATKPLYDNGATYGSKQAIAALLFEDDFSSGDLSKTQNGFIWLAPTNTSVVTTNPLSGSYSLMFDFAYLQTAEQRFNMGNLYSEITMLFDIYIPDGSEVWGGLIYEHYNSQGGASDNNKWWRLWDTNPESGNPEKVGGSTRAADVTGISKLEAEWNKGDGSGMTGRDSSDNFINASDRGNWFNFKVYHKAATVADNDGIFKVYKNDNLIINRTDVDNYDAAGDHAWQFGYLLGSMGGALPDGPDHMYLFIDNFKLYSGEF